MIQESRNQAKNLKILESRRRKFRVADPSSRSQFYLEAYMANYLPTRFFTLKPVPVQVLIPLYPKNPGPAFTPEVPVPLLPRPLTYRTGDIIILLTSGW